MNLFILKLNLVGVLVNKILFFNLLSSIVVLFKLNVLYFLVGCIKLLIVLYDNGLGLNLILGLLINLLNLILLLLIVSFVLVFKLKYILFWFLEKLVNLNFKFLYLLLRRELLLVLSRLIFSLIVLVLIFKLLNFIWLKINLLEVKL